MTERAIVREIHDDSVMVECVENSGCDGCSSSFCNVNARTFRAAITPEIPVKTGDQVEVFVPPSRAILSGFFVLIFPLLLFVGAYLAFGFLENEATQVGAGLGGLFSGFGLVYLIGSRRPNDLPRIVRVYRGPELIPAKIHGASV